jgi:hypothetical protein
LEVGGVTEKFFDAGSKFCAECGWSVQSCTREREDLAGTKPCYLDKVLKGRCDPASVSSATRTQSLTRPNAAFATMEAKSFR